MRLQVKVSSVAVDRDDHVWILHRPDSGPAVLEFDGSGRYLGGWGGPADGYSAATICVLCRTTTCGSPSWS